MSFVLTKGADDEYATEFAYAACACACVASENQAIRFYVIGQFRILTVGLDLA